MAGLTRSFKESVKARMEREPAFREALLADAVESVIAGEREVGKAMLRDFIGSAAPQGQGRVEREDIDVARLRQAWDAGKASGIYGEIDFDALRAEGQVRLSAAKKAAKRTD